MNDSLNSFLFSTPEMTRVFSPENQLRAMMRFECALASALEDKGLAQPGSAAVIEAMCDAKFVNRDLMASDAKSSGNIAIPFVQQLTEAVNARDQGAARSIHLGATSQDVLDSALVLQMREGLELIANEIQRLDAALVRQVKDHRSTILAGRTWMQTGPPTTLGLKLAGSLSALRRSRSRLEAARDRTLVLQFGGAVGTQAALGRAAQAVTTNLAHSLTLREPDLPWHTQRDSLVELVEVLALVTGSLAKFAGDIALLMQPEVGEASESRTAGKGGSSTMPHKHNPVACAAVVAVHARIPGLVATMLHAMPQQHERGLGLWQAEWETVPEVFRLAAASLSYALEIAEHLEVDRERIRANLDAQLGLPLSEAVSVALSQKIGRREAHAVLRDISGRAAAEARHLSDVLKESPAVTQHLSSSDIDRLCDPREYLGSSDRFIARVLGECDAQS